MLALRPKYRPWPPPRVQSRDWQHIPDVERNGYCFSNGCGTVSPLLAREMAQEMWRQGRRVLRCLRRPCQPCHGASLLLHKSRGWQP